MGIGLGIMEVDGELFGDFMSSPSPVVSPVGKRSSGPETNFRIITTPTTLSSSPCNPSSVHQQQPDPPNTTTNNGNFNPSSTPTPMRTRGRRGLVHNTGNNNTPNTNTTTPTPVLISQYCSPTANTTDSYHQGNSQISQNQQLNLSGVFIHLDGVDHEQPPLPQHPPFHKYGLPHVPRSLVMPTTHQNATHIRVDSGQAQPGVTTIPVSLVPGTYPNPTTSGSHHKSQSRWGRNSVTLPVPSPPTIPSVREAAISPIFPAPLETEAASRTLISTEAQTEDSPPPPPPSRNRELRKRERRERRLRERSERLCGAPQADEPENGGAGGTSLGLPDLLNLPPPPYSTLPSSEVVAGRRQGLPCSSTPSAGTVPFILGQPPQCTDPTGERRERSVPPTCISPPPHPQPLRYHFSPPDPHPPTSVTRHTRRSFRSLRGIPYASEEEPKSCCGMSTTQAVSIRWFIVIIAAIGICCTVAGTALGAARSAGSQHLTLALLMIGVGVVLLTVSAVAWRLTANESGSSSCRAMLGFGRAGISRGDGGSEPNRVFVPRLPPSYGRPHHPYAAMLYPDFQYRPPPPSYQASMQEYRLRLLLLERSNPNIPHVTHLRDVSAALPQPPPPYRPYNNGLIRPTTISRTEVELSRPPSYGSRIGCAEFPNGNEQGDGREHAHVGPRERRRESQVSRQVMGSEDLGSGDLSPVVTVMEVNVEMEMGERWAMEREIEESEEERAAKGLRHPLDELKDPTEEKHRTELSVGMDDEGTENGKYKDGNLVRIVQTTDSSQVIGRDSVIVTVSGSQNSLVWDQQQQQQQQQHAQSTTNNNNQVQILAHL